jgi:predicted MFS family arabinose efflux permease
MDQAHTSVRALLRNRGVSGLLGAEVISGLGSMMTTLALPWFVLQTTRSAARAGLVLAVEVLPIILFGIPSGVVAAKLGARTTLLLCNLLWPLLIGLIPILHWTEALSLPVLLSIVFLSSLLWTPFIASQQTLLAELLDDDEAALGQANALFQGAVRTTYWLGPLLAGLLIASFGSAIVLLIDAATFLIALLLLGLLVPPSERPSEVEEPGGQFAGLRFLLGNRLLRALTVSQVLSQASFQALTLAIPVLAFLRYNRNATIAGILEAAWGAGALVGSVSAIPLVRRFDSLILAPVAWLGQALPLWLLVASPPVFAITLALFASGVGNGVRVPPMTSLSIVRVPRHLRSQALSAGTTLAMAGGLVALGVTGPALEAVGETPVFAALAAASSAAAILFLFAARRELSVRSEDPHPR